MLKDLLISAIQKKQVVSLRYHAYSRTVEPHCLGLDKDGEMKLRCWQTAGGSESGERQGWKLLNVQEIQSASLDAQTFLMPRPHYNPQDSAMVVVLARL